MKVIAVDPGYNFTGVASLDGARWTAKQYSEPWDAWCAVENCLEYHPRDAILLVEDYRSAGHLTKEAKETIGIVGMFMHMAPKMWAFELDTVLLRVEQHRLSGRREAAGLMGGTIEDLEKDNERKDAFSALAHCCAYRKVFL
jgi:hypothetical protein